jgi:selenophosphate synthetase-related protein
LQYSPFTSFDISVLKSILSREPNEKELNFIGASLEPLISRRYFIDFSKDSLFLKALNNSHLDNEHGLSYSCSTLKDISILNMLLTQKTIYKDISCTTVNHHDKNSLISIKDLAKKLKEIDLEPSHILLENYRSEDEYNYREFIFSIGTGQAMSSPTKYIPIDSSIYLITHKSKSVTKQFKQMYQLIREINTNSKVFSKFLLDGYTPIFTILSYIMDQEGGVKLQFNRETDIFDILFHTVDFGLIIFGNKRIYQNIRKVNENQFDVIRLGRCTDQNSLIIYVRNNQQFFFPKNIFSFLWRSDNTISSTQRKKVKNITKLHSLKKLKCNKSFIAILKRISNDNKLYKINRGDLLKKENADKAVFWEDININGFLTIAFSEYNHFSTIDPESAGKIAISNAVRSVRCAGANVIGVIIQNTFSTNSDFLSNSVSLNKSQDIAIKHFELDVLSKKINLDSKIISQDIAVIGNIPDKDVCLSSGFKQADHFISILGSHKGELVGSVFQKCFPNSVGEHPVTIDLDMENKLGEVIKLGIESRLIQTATNVGKGGLSTAISSNLITSPDEMGARIHLSRKLKPEELLFGETHGLVLISLREEDIMEFERICMNIGVPCTTIGRVTNTGRLTFNDMIDISTVELKIIHER